MMKINLWQETREYMICIKKQMDNPLWSPDNPIPTTLGLDIRRVKKTRRSRLKG